EFRRVLFRSERTVLPVGLKQPVEAQKRCQQRADPQHGRADARQKVEVRPDAERHDGDDREEEQYANQRAATGAETEAQVSQEKRQHQAASSEQAAMSSVRTPSRPRGRSEER